MKRTLISGEAFPKVSTVIHDITSSTHSLVKPNMAGLKRPGTNVLICQNLSFRAVNDCRCAIAHCYGGL